MELVPIVYTSLIIFSILAGITIVVSYIFYKIRTRNQDTSKFQVEEEKLRLEKEAERKKKEGQIKLAKEAQRKKKEAAAQKEEREKQQRAKQEKKRQREKPTREKKRSKTRGNRRIEILTVLKPDNKKDKKNESSEKEKPSNKNLKSLGDRVIDKYSDSEDDFYTLNVEKKKKKK